MTPNRTMPSCRSVYKYTYPVSHLSNPYYFHISSISGHYFAVYKYNCSTKRYILRNMRHFIIVRPQKIHRLHIEVLSGGRCDLNTLYSCRKLSKNKSVYKGVDFVVFLETSIYKTQNSILKFIINLKLYRYYVILLACI